MNYEEKYREAAVDEKKNILVEFGKEIYLKKGRSLLTKDLEAAGIKRQEIIRIFGSFKNFYAACGTPPRNRGLNLSDAELKQYIESIALVTENGCWVTDVLNFSSRDNRTQIKYKGKTTFLYRVAYQLFKGPLDPTLCIMHQCDNERCFNPDHLEQGTVKDNNRSITSRGRRVHPGKRKPASRLDNPYDYVKLLSYIKSNSDITEKGEWLYRGSISSFGYSLLTIKQKTYYLHRLVLANKLSIKYEDITAACHRFPQNSPHSRDKPQKNDVNPEHLYNGTFSDNMCDARGYHKGYELSFDMVKFISEEIKKTDFSKIRARDFDSSIAQKFGVSVRSVQELRLGNTYQDTNSGKPVKGIRGRPGRAVIQMNLDGSIVQKHVSVNKAGRQVGVGSSSMIWACERQKPYKNFIWKYEDQQ